MFRYQLQHPKLQAVVIFAGLGLLTTLLRTLILPFKASDALPLYIPIAALMRVVVTGAAWMAVWWATREGQRTRLEVLALVVLGFTYSVWAVWYDRPAAVLMVVPIMLRIWLSRRQAIIAFVVLALASMTLQVLIPPAPMFKTQDEWDALVQLIVLTLIQGGFAYAAFELMLGRNEERQRLNAALIQLERAQEVQLRNVALEERAHLSRELHDTIGHHMTALNLHTQRAQFLYQHGDPRGQLPEALSQIEGRGQEVVADLQQVVRTLRSAAAFELLPAVRALVQQWPGEVELDLPRGEPPLRPEQAFAVLRGLQEALTNVQKHAPGAKTWVSLSLQDQTLLLQVTNSLAKMAIPSTASRGGHGLVGLRERIEALGGTLETPTTKEYYTLCLTLPLR